MEVFTFVMHAPSDYFHNTKAPYKTSTLPPAGKGDIKIRRLGPRVIRTVDNKTVYVGIYSWIKNLPELLWKSYLKYFYFHILFIIVIPTSVNKSLNFFQYGFETD